MFTGIIEEVGRVEAFRPTARGARIVIAASTVLEGTNVGDSIAVNGVCLTVTDLTPKSFSADVMNETLNRSNLGSLRSGSPVNLERAMVANGRFGGHIVTGHIDTTAPLSNVAWDGDARWFWIELAPEFLPHVVEKGSIALDGVSLTVADKTDRRIAVSLIPHTQMHTTFDKKQAGDFINVELDIVGKYVESLLGAKDLHLNSKVSTPTPQSGITEAFLRENGF